MEIYLVPPSVQKSPIADYSSCEDKTALDFGKYLNVQDNFGGDLDNIGFIKTSVEVTTISG